MHLSKGDYGVLESGAILVLSSVDWMSTEKRASRHSRSTLAKLVADYQSTLKRLARWSAAR